MRRKITAGLILRKDGRYQRNELIGDKRRTFTAKDPAKVWADIQKAQEEYEEQERQRIITRDSGPLFSVATCPISAAPGRLWVSTACGRSSPT